MIQLNDTAYGYKQRAVIQGINSWTKDSLNLVWEIQITNQSDVKITGDNSINQDRRVVYNVNKNNFVDAGFNPVEEGTEGAQNEYDFIINYLTTTLFFTMINQLEIKLNQRGIFD